MSEGQETRSHTQRQSKGVSLCRLHQGSGNEQGDGELGHIPTLVQLYQHSHRSLEMSRGILTFIMDSEEWQQTSPMDMMLSFIVFLLGQG